MIDIDGFMADVIIAADDEVRSLFAQFVHPDKEILEKLHLEILPDVSGCTAGDIGIDDRQVPEVDPKYSSLAVILGITHTYHHFIGFVLAEDTDTRVPFLLRRMDERAVSEFLKRHDVYLVGLRFALLDAE